MINESQKAEKKQNFCIRFLEIVFLYLIISMPLEGKIIWMLHCLQVDKWLLLYMDRVNVK